MNVRLRPTLYVQLRKEFTHDLLFAREDLSFHVQYSIDQVVVAKKVMETTHWPGSVPLYFNSIYGQ